MDFHFPLFNISNLLAMFDILLKQNQYKEGKREGEGETETRDYSQLDHISGLL